MSKNTPPGGDRRYSYVPFARLSQDDQRRVRGAYVHKVAHLPDEEYLYPVDKSGRSVSARRWISQDRAKKLFELRDAGNHVVARSRSRVGAHRASRTRSNIGSTVNRAGGSHGRTKEEWIAQLRWNIKDATEALSAAAGMQKWQNVTRYAKQLEALEAKLAKAEGSRPRIHLVQEGMYREAMARKYPESAADRRARLRRIGYSVAGGA